ncbi:MAG: hypothetical protein F4107_05500 [Gemmatimonadetes bacterium]|nr:hypothetical protein [Gemmatimonadota bacterium]MYD12639.1 hypothetical protein [Gemmatimonadota bacterium]MYI65386.1 hypothetical protein [Gemmatimonadota bacterium]
MVPRGGHDRAGGVHGAGGAGRAAAAGRSAASGGADFGGHRDSSRILRTPRGVAADPARLRRRCPGPRPCEPRGAPQLVHDPGRQLQWATDRGPVGVDRAVHTPSRRVLRHAATHCGGGR